MIITENDGKWTLNPVNSIDGLMIDKIISTCQPGNKIRYCGCVDESDKFVNTNFHIAGHAYTLVGSDETSKYAINGIRNTCYFGSGGLIYLGSEDGRSVIVTGKLCQHCQAPMTSMSRCEWDTCHECVEKCQHHWTQGLVHGGGVELAAGEYCQKCGIGRQTIAQ